MPGMSLKMNSSEKIETAAGDWFARRESGEWTAVEQAGFQAWLEESPLHRVAYLRIEHAWERAQRLKALGSGAPSHHVPAPGSWVLSPFFRFGRAERPPRRSRLGVVPGSWSRMRPILRLTATLAAVLIVAVAWVLWPSGTTYSTPVGGVETVHMADNSTVILNTNTALRLALTKSERLVILKQGEAFFEVAKDPARPFVVQVGSRDVVAVGTRFSVRREGSDLEVVVTEGTVRLEPSTAVSPRVNAWQSAALVNEFLPAGTVAQVGDAGVLVQKETPTEAAARLSWREGVLVFRDASLGEAISEFNRYNIRQIVIADPSVGALKIAGRFRATNADAFVRLLERGYSLKVEEQGNELILKAR